MAKISDEIRKWCADLDSDDILCTTATLYTLADRIDSEMVELPRDRDGVPIHVGDTVYGHASGMQMQVTAMRLEQAWSITTTRGFAKDASIVTHTVPDSWERIADELEAWCDGADVDGDAYEKPRDLADRIRKLAKEGE